MKVRGGLLVAGFLGVLSIAACGHRSGDTANSGASSRVPSDIDSMAFQPESARVRADIDSGNAQYLQAWRVGSGDLLANIFTEDGELTRKDGTVIGHDSITAVMGRVFAHQRMRRGNIVTQSIHINGDQAVETGRYSFELGPVRGGTAVRDSGAYLQIWKYESGQWKMWRSHGGRA